MYKRQARNADQFAIEFIAPPGGVEHALDDLKPLFDVDEVVQQDDEFVTPQACDGVGFAQDSHRALGKLDQQPVTTGVPKAVVDRLETIQIEQTDGQPGLLAPGCGDRHVQSVVEQRPVGQIGQQIEVCQFLQALLVLLVQGDVDVYKRQVRKNWRKK